MDIYLFRHPTRVVPTPIGVLILLFAAGRTLCNVSNKGLPR